MYDTDIQGKKFGSLLVLQQVPKPQHLKTRGKYWLCLCDCGTQKIIYGKSLRYGKTISCGCIRQNQAEEKFINKRFGKLTVIKATSQRSNDGHIIFQCQCDCGNIHYAASNNLQSGHANSCGCLQSIGEFEIKQLLLENHIDFKTQISFDDLKSKKGYPLRFDFGIYRGDELLYLIEFQGEQHYDFSSSFFDTPKENDRLKANYCEKNNIKIIYIPFWKRHKISIKDLILEVEE